MLMLLIDVYQTWNTGLKSPLEWSLPIHSCVFINYTWIWYVHDNITYKYIDVYLEDLNFPLFYKHVNESDPLPHGKISLEIVLEREFPQTTKHCFVKYFSVTQEESRL